MSLPEEIKTVLDADNALMDILTGGVFVNIMEINRQDAPEAFDANKEIMPCALIKLGVENKLGDTRRGVQTPIIIYVYQRNGYDDIYSAMELIFEHMNEAKIGNATWNIRFSNAVYDQRDIALDCSLATLRFVAARMR